MWCQGSRVEMDGVTLAGNERASVIIDGPVGEGSRIAHLTLSDGDESKGILQQDLPAGGLEPEIGPGAPALEVDTGTKLVVNCL